MGQPNPTGLIAGWAGCLPQQVDRGRVVLRGYRRLGRLSAGVRSLSKELPVRLVRITVGLETGGHSHDQSSQLCILTGCVSVPSGERPTGVPGRLALPRSQDR
jgi:hypothetical protein